MDGQDFQLESRRLQQQESDIVADRGRHWFLIDKSNGQILGGVALTNIRRGVAHAGTLGYWTGEPYAGQGYMKEAVASIVHHAHTELKLHRVEAATVLDNLSSQRVLRSCGFEEEGLARQYLKINGVWSDHLLFAHISDDD